MGHDPPKWGDRRRVRVGLLGGSFNPAHAGHLHVAQAARRLLRLDQVWLMVSPGNPLKLAHGMAAPDARLASARHIADGRRIVATDIEGRLGTRYTVDTLRTLRRRFPQANFVWVLPRPTYTHRALASHAAHRLAPHRLPVHAASALAGLSAPRWVFLPTAQNATSATAIRLNRSS